MPSPWFGPTPPRTTDSDVTGSGARRWQRVDMLRGVAVLLVLCRHHEALGVLHRTGWLGVDLFFVLSGFLVSGLIFDEYRRSGRFQAWRFLVRRGFKIYPSFYALILCSTLLMWATGRKDPTMNYVAEVFFFQNYHEGLWIHTWSLAVEEHFYLLLVIAAVVLILSRTKFHLRTMIASCAALFLLILGLRMVTYLSSPFSVRTHMFVTHLRIDSLLAGVLLAAWHRFRPLSFARVFGAHLLILCGAMFLLLLPATLPPFGSWWMGTIGLSTAYVAGALAVGSAVARSAHEVPAHLDRWVVRPLAWIGGISYTTYLWHLLVLLVVELGSVRIGMKGTWPEFMVFVAGSIAMGLINSVAIERPALRMRERWFPAWNKHAAPLEGRLSSIASNIDGDHVL